MVQRNYGEPWYKGTTEDRIFTVAAWLILSIIIIIASTTLGGPWPPQFCLDTSTWSYIKNPRDCESFPLNTDSVLSWLRLRQVSLYLSTRWIAAAQCQHCSGYFKISFPLSSDFKLLSWSIWSLGHRVHLTWVLVFVLWGAYLRITSIAIFLKWSQM